MSRHGRAWGRSALGERMYVSASSWALTCSRSEAGDRRFCPIPSPLHLGDGWLCSPSPRLSSQSWVSQRSLAWSGPAGRGDVQAVVVVGRGARQPPRPWLLLFSWESKPQNAGRFIHLPQGDPGRKHAIQMSLPAFLGNTHPEPMHVRAHTHALAHPH